MTVGRPLLVLAHSPDPDDAFMWWPITGKVTPAGEPEPGVAGRPAIDTGRFEYRALPADIEQLNRRAAGAGDLDITALSFRAYADVRDRYVLTSCGSSFGEGFGPKVVARASRDAARVMSDADLRDPRVRIAVPGVRTTAFLVLGMMLGPRAMAARERFVEMPFDQIIPAVVRADVDAGLVIHEGQVLYEQAGLVRVVDLGEWWGRETGLPLPLGCNAVRRDVETRFGPGSLADIARTLRRSVDHALAHRNESLAYTMPFALANTARSGSASGEPATLERVDRYVRMYVNRWTLDMGPEGVEGVRRLLTAGHAAGLCPDPGTIDVIGLAGA